jgi:hypothetical protein
LIDRPFHLACFPLACSVLLFLFSCSTLPSLMPTDAIRIPWISLGDGIDYAAFRYGNPRSDVHALRIDLFRVDVIVTRGSGLDGIVVGKTVSDFAKEYSCYAAVNATPFSPATDKPGEARLLTGILLVDGIQKSPPAPRYAALAFEYCGTGQVIRQAEPGDLSIFRIVVGGFFPLLDSGMIVARESRREPMTTAGLSRDGRTLYAVVIDGRRPGSAGATEKEAAAILVILGASDALSFDGGGSSAIAIRGVDGTVHLANKPTHGGVPGRERVVGTVLGWKPVSPTGSLPLQLDPIRSFRP